MLRDWGAFRIHVGDCREAMGLMADRSVQCCVTSPPYFGLRDYGHAGQIGLEPTPDEYVAQMVEVFRGVRRVLKDDGTLWLNLGDSYAGHHGNKNSAVPTSATNGWTNGTNENLRTSTVGVGGLKAKDLIGVPWRVAFALQADGWYLRQDIIWHKPNPMPESVTDRCTKAHEYVFLFSKSPRYYFDSEAMKEPAVGALAGNRKPAKGAAAYGEGDEAHRTKAGLHQWAERQRHKRGVPPRHAQFPSSDQSGLDDVVGREMRNRRSVWSVATRPYKGAHFATYPPALIEPCVLAGSRPGDLVLDPFGGSGTTGEVACKAGRRAVLCELNPAYADLAVTRIAAAVWGVTA